MKGNRGHGALAKKGAFFAVALPAVAVALIAWPREPGGLQGWLAAVQDPHDDRGWDFIDPMVQRMYRGGVAAYVEDMAAVDWDALELSTPEDVWVDDGMALVQAELRSDPATVPAILLQHGVVRGLCEDGDPIGIWVIENRGLLGRDSFGALNATGTQIRCDAEFADPGD